MKYTRMYAGPDGESHFEDVEVELSAGAGGTISEIYNSAGMMFRRTTPTYDVRGTRRRVVTSSSTSRDMWSCRSATARRASSGRAASSWRKTRRAEGISAAQLTAKSGCPSSSTSRRKTRRRSRVGSQHAGTAASFDVRYLPTAAGSILQHALRRGTGRLLSLCRAVDAPSQNGTAPVLRQAQMLDEQPSHTLKFNRRRP